MIAEAIYTGTDIEIATNHLKRGGPVEFWGVGVTTEGMDWVLMWPETRTVETFPIKGAAFGGGTAREILDRIETINLM